jgi:hypothetical protein
MISFRGSVRRALLALIVLASCNEPTLFDSSKLDAQGASDSVSPSEGAYQWHYALEDLPSAYAAAVGVARDGSVLFGGGSYGIRRIDLGKNGSRMVSGGGYFVTRLNSNGTHASTLVVGSAEPYTVFPDVNFYDEGFVVYGSVRGHFDLDPGTRTESVLVPEGGGFVSRFEL